MLLDTCDEKEYIVDENDSQKGMMCMGKDDEANWSPGDGFGPGRGGRGKGRGGGFGPGCRGGHGGGGPYRGRGFRLTVPRQIILEILEGADEYLSADDVYLQVHQRHPGIGLATVYRTLQLLAEIGIVHRIDTGEGKARYKLAEQDERRHREVLICTHCRRSFPVTEIPENQHSLLDQLEELVKSENGFTVQQNVVQLYGVCRECSQTNTQ